MTAVDSDLSRRPCEISPAPVGLTTLAFTVPGEPRGKARPRIIRFGGHASLKADDATAAYEATWAALAHKAMAGRPLMLGPVSVGITARFTPPQSASRIKREAMLAGQIRPTKRPDLDNMVKCIDGLNGIVWHDDSQVVQLVASKAYAETPGVDVVVYPALAPVRSAEAEAA